MSDPLRVGAAFPDPPFNGAENHGGLDISLMEAVAEALSLRVELIPYRRPDFNGIFDELNAGAYDCVTALAVDVGRLPHVRSIDDLEGLTIGVQRGNTSQPIAEQLVAQGRAKAVHVYDYGDIRAAITDLTTGGCDAFIKLAPVLTQLVKPVAGVEVVQRGLSTERIATAVRRSDDDLLAWINAAQAGLERTGRLGELRAKWLGASELDQSGAGQKTWEQP
ncbi:ABC transporter substrate-binding protein [Mycobacterium sp.]|uniref:ABC transporter substrate-binding protein n=1 Tax=Mycobacterium sp. TaxID=1785 RepID=UPI002D52A4D2|nr:ABC transporter substrate-binding protein [Mycobacterium sp.]HZA11318.1 ABC transporter substrate-binding protein [Mycobacterium sp.]